MTVWLGRPRAGPIARAGGASPGLFAREPRSKAPCFANPCLRFTLDTGRTSSVELGPYNSAADGTLNPRPFDAHYDNALAEHTIGLYKNECIQADSPFRRGPLRTLGDVESLTADYVAWYNQQRLMRRLGRVPPAEAQAQYYSQPDRPTGRLPEPQGCMKPGMVHPETADFPVTEDVSTRQPASGFAPRFGPIVGIRVGPRRLRPALLESLD
jgi:hypothetical protein